MSEEPVTRLMAEGLELLVRKRVEAFVKEITLETVEDKVSELNGAIETELRAYINRNTEDGAKLLRVMAEITIKKGNMR